MTLVKKGFYSERKCLVAFYCAIGCLDVLKVYFRCFQLVMLQLLPVACQ